MKKTQYADTQDEAADLVASFVRDGCSMVTMTHIHGDTIDKYVVVGFMEEIQNDKENAH